MKVLYVTANVLGDAGANAAEIFPRLAFISPEIEKVIVADFGKNRAFIREKQFGDFLCMRRFKGWPRLYASMRQEKRGREY